VLSERILSWAKSRKGSVVARRVIAHARAFVTLPPRERLIYAQQYLKRRTSLAAAGRTVLHSRPRTILVVCFGNIMRSPLAAELLRQRLEAVSPPIEVTSAGVRAKSGRPTDPRMARAASALGISLAGHVSQRLTESLVEHADLILAMDHWNEAAILTEFPTSRGKIRLLGEFDPSMTHDVEIRDPFMGSEQEVEVCAMRVCACVEVLARSIAACRVPVQGEALS